MLATAGVQRSEAAACTLLPSTLLHVPKSPIPADSRPALSVKFDDFSGHSALDDYLDARINADPYDSDALVSLPLSASSEVPVSEELWLLAHLKRLVQDLRVPWLKTLNNACLCLQMKAGEWLYMCSSSSCSGDCNAMDYARHNVQSAVDILENIGQLKSGTLPAECKQQIVTIYRRLYRIFAHANYYHREEFDACEAKTGLYARFAELGKRYQLLPEDALPIYVGTSAQGIVHVASPTPDSTK